MLTNFLMFTFNTQTKKKIFYFLNIIWKERNESKITSAVRFIVGLIF